MVETISSVMALSIPLLAIFAFSPIGKALAEGIRARSGATQLSAGQDPRLEARVKALEFEIHQIREAIVLSSTGERTLLPRDELSNR